MYQYSIGLAVFDFVPIALSGIGLYFVTATATLWSTNWQRLAQFGALLILAGGLSKASWKLIVASQQIDISWMNSALFFCLAPGMFILANSVWGASNNKGSGAQKMVILASSALILGAIAIATKWPEQRYSSYYLLFFTTLGNLALAFQLIIKTWKLKRLKASVLLFCNILAVFIMAGLARLPDQSEGLQWIEELLNTASQGAFAFATYSLYSAVKSHSQENAQNENASS